MEKSADADALRQAYRKLARENHPDVSESPVAHDLMADINKAFKTLIDDDARAEYDAQLAAEAPESPRQRRGAVKPIIVKLRDKLKAHRTPVYAVAFAPDSGQLISSGFDNEVIWWDMASRTPFNRQRLESGVVSSLRAYPEGRLIASGAAENQIALWHVYGPEVASWRVAQTEWVACMEPSPDGRLIATGSVNKSIQILSAINGAVRHRISGHDASITALAWTANSKILATGGSDAQIWLWDPVTGRPLGKIPNVRSTVTAMAFSPN